MYLQTEWLEIIPLTPQLLKLWIEDIQKLELKLNCSYRAGPMKGIFDEQKKII